jgi:hypothetical protein
VAESETERENGVLKVKNRCSPEVAAPAEPVATATPTPVAAGPPAVLLLNADGSRLVTVKAPPTIKRHELERIKKWLEFQLIVEDEETGKEAGDA